MSRTGLAAEVPTLELCCEMAAIPALAEAFKGCYAIYPIANILNDGKGTFVWSEVPSAGSVGQLGIPAPTVREMLAWLRLELWSEPVGYDGCHHYIETWNGREVDLDIITDPDALARACIEAAR